MSADYPDDDYGEFGAPAPEAMPRPPGDPGPLPPPDVGPGPISEPLTPPPPSRSGKPSPPPTPGQLQDLLLEIITEVEQARTVPLSANVMLSREEMLRKLYRLREELPEELRAARWMVREREAFVARTNEKARELLEKARERSRELVSDSYIVKEAVEQANKLVRQAEGEARRTRLEAEDLAEQTLVEAETVLGELLQDIRAARAELHQARPRAPEVPE